MKNKIALGFGALAVALVALPMFAAFEAHVINVTAQIENALQVDTRPINFGTVFPQEELDKDIHVELSESFLREDRVDDVEYIIRQKPKCGVTTDDGETLVGPTWTGHVVVDPTGATTVDCEKDKPKDLVVGPGQTAGLLPLLCPYLSKHKNPSDRDGNDDELDAFHKIGSVVNGVWVWNDVKGKLSKIQQDIRDWWIIDLRVPCFGDHCGQDWTDFVKKHNPDADPNQYVLDKNLEHKVFGCNLWIEVTGVSETPATPGLQ